MSKRILFFCIVTILLERDISYAQVDANLDQLRTVIPPSPNTSSLGKFGEWPVGLFTGIPSINIPIYEVKGRSIAIPISIDYHASGIRIGETASWVGLGWALNAGGCISRTVQGLPDEDGYLVFASNYTTPNNLCSNATNSTTLVTDVMNAAQGTTDSQLDIYMLSVMGKSYRIYINAANDSAYTMPASNIRITSNFLQNTSSANSTWSVIMEDGTQLFFGGANPGNYLEQTSNSTMGTGNFVSAWYLQSIKSTTGETITFTYSPTTITQPAHFTQSDYINYLTSSTADAPFVASPATSTLVSYNTITQLSLSTIESDLTRVTFIPSSTTRTDLQGGVSLSEIQVLSKATGAITNDWTFNYNYSQAAAGNAYTAGALNPSYNNNRLKLASLTRNAVSGGPGETWTFGYNPLPLPSQTSYAQDYWGFYNGATTNTSLLPNIPFTNAQCGLFPQSYTGSFSYNQTLTFFTATGFMPTNHDNGNNRSANEAAMQAEMLNKITYPTGGYTVFNYEGNGQTVSQPVLIKNSNTLPLNLNSTSNPYTASQSFLFSTSSPEYVNIVLNSSISTGIYNDFPGAKVTAQLIDIASGAALWTSSASSTNSWINVFLPGNYKVVLSTNCTQDMFGPSDYITAALEVYYSTQSASQNVKQFFGGVRINNIQQFDGISTTPVNSRYYSYATPFLINPVDTIKDFLTMQNSVITNPNTSQTYRTKVTRNTSSKFSLGSIQGGTVGYATVTTNYGAGGAGGYTVSTFATDAASQASPASRVFPYPPTDGYTWRTGMLVGEKTYTSAGALVKTAYNKYGFVRAFQLNNLKCGTATAYSSDHTQSQIYSGITALCFSLTNEAVQKTSITQSTFDIVTGDSVSTTTNYYYDDPANFEPVRSVTLDSKLDTVLTYTRTALEESAINSSIPLTATAITALNTMVTNNMVSQPVESEEYIKGVLMKKGLTNYKVESNGYVQPDNVMMQVTNNPIETRLLFKRYDSYGNLVQQQRDNDAYRTYLWDYQHQYVIAQCINADSVDIAYCSFEADGGGSWTVPSANRDTGGITGSRCYNLSNGAITRSNLTSATTYVVSFWARTTSSVALSGGSGAITGKTIGGWTYHEYALSGVTSVTVSGSGDIDELRLYPSNAQMTTYTYTPLVGMSSQCDVDNRVTYYVYDGLMRLSYIKDQDLNVIKRYCYNYNGNTTNCQLLPPAPVVMSNATTSSMALTFVSQTSGLKFSFTCNAGSSSSTLGYLPADTYNVSITPSSPSNVYPIIFVCTGYTQTYYATVGFNNIVASGTLTLSASPVPQVQVNSADEINQTVQEVLTNSYGGQFTFNLSSGAVVTNYVPAGTYSVLMSNGSPTASYQIDFTANGNSQYYYGPVGFSGVDGSSQIHLTSYPAPTFAVMASNNTTKPVTLTFTNTVSSYAYTFTVPVGASNSQVGTVPEATYNVLMTPNPSNSSQPILWEIYSSSQTYYGPVGFNNITVNSTCPVNIIKEY